MAQARLSVRKIREVLRLKAEARLSDRQIAAVLGSARSTVQECLRRARDAGMSWPPPAELDDDELFARLYPRAPVPPRYPAPDFPAIQAELAQKGVTRMLLWREYKARHPNGCQYSAFCRDYDAWLGRQDAVVAVKGFLDSGLMVTRFTTRPMSGRRHRTRAGLRRAA